MKVNKINNFNTYSRQNFTASRLPYVKFNNITDTFAAMDNKFIDAETDLIRSLAKRHPELHQALKQRVIPAYEVPFIKTLLVNPVFDDVMILKEIPYMLSIKLPRELANKQRAQGRKNLVDKFALNPLFNENQKLKAKFGEILLNCSSFENSEMVGRIMDRIANNQILAQNKNLNKKLPEIITNLQDGLYDTKIDIKGIEKGYNHVLDKYLSSDLLYKNEKINSNIGNMLTEISDYKKAIEIANKM